MLFVPHTHQFKDITMNSLLTTHEQQYTGIVTVETRFIASLFIASLHTKTHVLSFRRDKSRLYADQFMVDRYKVVSAKELTH